jgi:hypothetical protein
MIHSKPISDMLEMESKDPIVPPEISAILRDFARNRDNGQVILNLNEGEIRSYKLVRYVRVIDKGSGGSAESA